MKKIFLIRVIIKFYVQRDLEQSSTIKKCVSCYTDSLKKDINIYNFPIDPKKINKIVLDYDCLSFFKLLQNIGLRN